MVGVLFNDQHDSWSSADCEKASFNTSSVGPYCSSSPNIGKKNINHDHDIDLNLDSAWSHPYPRLSIFLPPQIGPFACVAIFLLICVQIENAYMCDANSSV